jgi:hypothetical protein
MSQPSINRFVTAGIDQIIKVLKEAALGAFKPTLLKVRPNIFKGPAWKILAKEIIFGSPFSNSTILGTLTKDHQSIAAMMPKFLDFCDLLPHPTKKVQLGGTRNELHGTFVSKFLYLL